MQRDIGGLASTAHILALSKCSNKQAAHRKTDSLADDGSGEQGRRCPYQSLFHTFLNFSCSVLRSSHSVGCCLRGTSAIVA